MKKVSLLITLILTCISIDVYSEGTVALEMSDWRPYVYMENNQPTGLAYVIVKAVFDRANIAYEFKTKPWARVYNNGLNKKNYFIPGLGRTPERELLFQWIGPTTKRVDVYFYKLKSNPIQIKRLEEAKEHLTGVERGAYHQDFLEENFPPNKIQEVSRPEQLLRMLLKKRVDFILLEEAVVLKLSEKLDVDPHLFEKSLIAFRVQEYLAASLHTDKALVDQLKKAYVALEKENIIDLH